MSNINPWGYYLKDGAIVPKTQQEYYNDLILVKLKAIEERLAKMEAAIAE